MSTVRTIRAAGEDVVHLREEGLITLPDDQIMAKAVKETRVVLTFDLDFGDLPAAGGGTTPSVIVFRMRNQTPGAVNPRLFRVLETCRSALEKGSVVIVEDDGYKT